MKMLIWAGSSFPHFLRSQLCKEDMKTCTCVVCVQVAHTCTCRALSNAVRL